MWIRTQNRQRIVNTDRLIDIYIDKTGKKILANTTEEATYITLGEYKDRDECLKVIDIIHACFDVGIKTIVMPLGGEIDEWIEDSAKQIENGLVRSMMNAIK